MVRWYKLVNREPVPCDITESEVGKHIVARTAVGDHEVSTVFLSLDHQFLDGPPLLFETMIFPAGDYCERYSTWDEAEAGHAKAVALLERQP